jgi:hypothetical protein
LVSWHSIYLSLNKIPQFCKIRYHDVPQCEAWIDGLTKVPDPLAANPVCFPPYPLAACNASHCLRSNFLIRNEIRSGGDEMKPHNHEDCEMYAKIKKIELIEGYNWKYFPSPDGSKNCLAIFYSPVEVRPPSLPYFKQTAALPCARLLINPFSDEFFQDCIEETADLIRAVAA